MTRNYFGNEKLDSYVPHDEAKGDIVEDYMTAS